ncbi:shikimate kinase AroL [Enterobacteriaceae bacterium ESL0689]|nr:shikimate kinase AroL [Enterobacteriaceae bacterium ESL0689]
MTLPIFLIGSRGCGKTTIGAALAQQCQYQFTDTDHVLQEREQRTVTAIVRQEGWARFRELESSVLKAATQPATVIATGGGIILAQNNRQHMRENGAVIYLQVPVSVLVERLNASPQAEQRPTLTGKSLCDEVSEVLAQREALYRETAHYIIDATMPADRVVSHIMALSVHCSPCRQ